MQKILTEKFSVRILISGIIIFFLAIIIFSFNNWNFATDQDIQLERLSGLADFIGGFVGPIWALVGVILFYVALTEQRKDFTTNREALKAQTKALEQQIIEFELQREELAETREVFKIQNDTFRKQQFESTFFNLVNLHHLIVNSINLSKRVPKYPGLEKLFTRSEDRDEKTSITIHGKDCFGEFRKSFIEKFHEHESKSPEKPTTEKLEESYWEFFQQNQSQLGHYFRNLYHIFKFINNSNEPNKLIYSSLLRAQMSNDELFMLFYNCLSSLGNQKFKPLVEDFHLLQNLNPDDLINIDHKQFYQATAF
ncbi:putative phage abortive infection protein [Flavobacterium ovatum]|uniref:putative phage abortive infection protein n=1 Tax=Flavobacterium ovatum TaxID=1928857 RepID=UPI0034503530